jgi:hypothetical protein
VTASPLSHYLSHGDNNQHESSSFKMEKVNFKIQNKLNHKSISPVNCPPLSSSTSSCSSISSTSSELNYSQLNAATAALANTNIINHHHNRYLSSPLPTNHQSLLSNTVSYLNSCGNQNTQNSYLNHLIAINRLEGVQTDKSDYLFNRNEQTHIVPSSIGSSLISHSTSMGSTLGKTTSHNIREMHQQQQSRHIYKLYSAIPYKTGESNINNFKKSKSLITPTMMSIEGNFS